MIVLHYFFCMVREDTHFCSGRTTKVLPSLHQWLSGPCHHLFFLLFLVLKWPETDFDNFFFFFPIFGLKSRILEKKVGFWLVVRGVYPPYIISGPTTKKTLFYACLPLVADYHLELTHFSTRNCLIFD